MEEICDKCGNILVVDDNPMNIRLLAEMLKNKGYSNNSITELYKWYDSSNKKGVASF